MSTNDLAVAEGSHLVGCVVSILQTFTSAHVAQVVRASAHKIESHEFDSHHVPYKLFSYGK